MYDIACQLEKQGAPFSTYDLYDKVGVRIGKITQKIAAINADNEIAGILNINAGDAVLVLESVIMDENMQPIEYKKGYYCTDKYTFNLNREI
jgi:DNA-binding GntR family transcriptional regulator